MVNQSIILVVALLLVGLYLYTQSVTEGFRPFSYLGEDISQGNCVSKSRQHNVYIPKDKVFRSSPKYVYFGTPNPLVHQMRPMSPPKNSMFYFANYKCAPECCPSPYSCSGGCVCIGPKNIYPCNNEPQTEYEIPGPNSF